VIDEAIIFEATVDNVCFLTGFLQARPNIFDRLSSVGKNIEVGLNPSRETG
jgi:hypothetical protein